MLTTSSQGSCPVCSAALTAEGPSYTTEELFGLWRPVRFSEKTIEEHRNIAASTQLHHCSGCGLGIFLPQIIGTPDFYVEAYNLTGSQQDSEFTYVDDKWEFGMALADARGCEKVIEFGCGNGNFLEKLRATVSEIAGVEYNPSALQSARDKGFRVFSGPDMATEAPGQWDAAFSFHVLEHVADPAGFMVEMKNAVKPGGLIGISVPNQDGPIRFIEPCIMNMPPHHATRWKISTFEALARRLGLTIRRIAREPLLLENHGYYSVHWVRHLLPGSSLLSSALRSLLSLGLRAFLGGLHRLGFRYFPILPGQSLYVLMSTPVTAGSSRS